MRVTILVAITVIAAAGCTKSKDATDAAVEPRVSTTTHAGSPSMSPPASAPQTRERWSEEMSTVCRQQAALSPSMSRAPAAHPDDVELGVRQLADAAGALRSPVGDVEVDAAKRRLDDSARTWLMLASAETSSAEQRAAATEELRTAVAALVAAGAADCEELSP